MPYPGTGLLRLLHIADSALPIGSTAHSFGLETLVQDNVLTPANLPGFLEDYFTEIGELEAAFCRRSYRIGAGFQSDQHGEFQRRWVAENQRLSALRPARESRTASQAMGGRFLRLLVDLTADPMLMQAIQAGGPDVHYCCAFGLGGHALQIDEDNVVLALLRQSAAGLVSACQRLMPLGQSRAAAILWQLHGNLAALATASADAADQPLPYTAPFLIDMGSMRHPTLPVRLFIS